ncbi:MAG: pectate lyase [Elusimicrobia bacterium RIFOXYA2_FULL_58_8]|nr:MAG: pectate lyase [Elusimicrobia bacterium RIFOXYA2_FULL_58_8]
MIIVMRKIAPLFILLSLTFLLLGSASVNDVKVFPGAEGFGIYTPAGRGGRVIKVTTLNSEGPGSLCEALAAKGPRVIVFEVGGIIDLRMKNIILSEPFITIAGQTAPSPGITLIRGGLRITAHDVLIQHIRFRPGDAGQPKKSGWEPEVTTFSAYNVVIDHCSFSWGVDENLSVSGPAGGEPGSASRDITLSNNIIAEALHVSSHRKGPHSMGTLIGDNCAAIAIIGNLYAHNYDRNPSFKKSTSGIIANNVVYNPHSWAFRISWTQDNPPAAAQRPADSRVSVIGNYMLHGRDTKPEAGLLKTDVPLFMRNNIALNRSGKTMPQTAGTVTLLHDMPVWPKDFTPASAATIIKKVLQGAGARPKDRDAVDLRIIKDFKQRKGRIINSQNEVGGYPETAATTRTLKVPTKNIDEWLTGLARELESEK